MRLTTVTFALFASLAMAAPGNSAGAVGAAAAPELVARGSCPAGCGCDGGICRCASCNENGCYWYDNGTC